MGKKWRYYICIGCKMQTASMSVDSDRVIHVYCGEEMVEVSGRFPKESFLKTYNYRIEKEEEGLMKRWFYCVRCRQQTWVLNKEIDYLLHKPCKARMKEMACHANEVPHTEDFVPIYKEKTVKFEVGDKVSIQGTVHHRCDDGTYSLIIEYGAKGDGFRSQRNFEPEQLTLVERPKKFKVGTKYHCAATDWDYMYLGDKAWYCYNTKNAYTTIAYDVELHMVELDS